MKKCFKLNTKNQYLFHWIHALIIFDQMSKTHAPNIDGKCEKLFLCYVHIIMLESFQQWKLCLPNLVAKFLICKPVNEKALLTHAIKIPTFHQNANG